MKRLISTTIAILTVLIFLGSCTTTNDVVSNSSIVKRKYRKGYYVQLPPLFNKQHPALSVLPIEEKDIDPAKSDEKMLFTASAGNDIPLVSNEGAADFKPVSKFSGTIKSVKHLYDSDIADFTAFRTEYKKIKKDFRSNFTLSGKNSEDPVKSEGGTYGLSIASFASALVGLIVAGIILGSLAVILGIIALAKKKKGRVLAIIGIVLGIADIILVAIYLSTL